MIWLKIVTGIVLWIIAVGFILLQFRLIKDVQANKLRKLNKLDFVDWYQENKDEALNNIEKRCFKSAARKYDLETEIDYEYQLYLRS